MPRKKTTVEKVASAAAVAAVKATQEDKPNLSLNWGDTDDEVDEQAASEILEDLAKIDEESGGQVSWELYCDSPMDKAGQVRKLSREELRNLRDECLALGPGHYHVIARRRDGLFAKDSRRNIKISGLARPAATATPAMDPLLLLEQLESRAERRRREQEARNEAKIKFWAPLLMPVGLELAKGFFGARTGDSIKDLVGALVGMKDLIGGGSKDVDTLLKGIQLARELTPEEPAKGSTWPDVLVNGLSSLAKEIRPVAEAAIAARKNGNGATEPARLQYAPAQASSAAPALEKPTPEAATDSHMTFILPLLTKLSQDLEEYAANATEASLAADALLAKIPRLIRSQVAPQQLKEWLSRADWWELTVQFRRTLAPYQAFCDDVRQELLAVVDELLNPPDETSEESPHVS